MMTTVVSDKGANMSTRRSVLSYNVILYLLQENAKCSTTCFMIELLAFFFYSEKFELRCHEKRAKNAFERRSLNFQAYQLCNYGI